MQERPAMPGSQIAPSALVPRRSRDGSFSLYSPEFAEGFHCADGALSEARRVFVAPAELGRFPAGSRLRVLEVAVGTGTNTAALVQACQERGLRLEWWGLELDPFPLQLALADDGFRRQWPGSVLRELQTLANSERLLWGDGRARLSELLERLEGRCALVLHDAFSPRHCPQLWSQEFLVDLAGLLAPRGRLLTYCSAAAVRRALLLAGLQLAAINAMGAPAADPSINTHRPANPERGLNAPDDAAPEASCPAAPHRIWSAGTAASPSALPSGGVLRPLTPMELEHLACRAGEPYRDPERNGTAADILERRQQQQLLSTAETSGQWQRRWGLARRHGSPPAISSPPQTDPDRRPAGQGAVSQGPDVQGPAERAR